tara:strand:- start:3106 stop:3765 length:660 start_codon:yes stop_codon:yes gene_type:complete
MYKYIREDTNEKINIPFDWCDVTLEKYIGFYDIIKDLDPEDIKEQLFNDLDLFHNIIEYWTGIKGDKMSYQVKIDMFTKLAFLFSPIEYTKLMGFQHEGVVYHLPESKIDYYGNEAPLASATFSEVVECFELEKNKLFVPSLPYILAILCKPFGEQYDDQNVNERSESFKTLPMNIVWSIAFFLNSLKNIYKRISNHYLRELMREAGLTSTAGIMPSLL